MDEILRLNEFFVEGGRQEQSHVLLHITEPSTEEEIDKGYFFAICEINQGDAAYIARLQQIIDQAENSYYELPDEEGKNSLEILLEKINQETPALLKPGVVLNCVIGAIRQPEIFFTYHGAPHVMLFYKDRQGQYKKMDLIASQGDDRANVENGNQLFSQIVQGKVSPQDFLFAGTPHITDYFNCDRLEKIITTRPALESARHLERVLGELKDGFSFGGLIINISPLPIGVKKMRPSGQINSANSLRGLLSTERQTSHTLSSSIIPRLQNKLSVWFDRPTVLPQVGRKMKNIKKEERVYAWNGFFDAMKQTIPKIFVAVVRGLWLAATLVVTAIKNTLQTGGLLVIAAFNYQNRRRTILEDWKRRSRGYRENFRQLSPVTKILFVSAIMLGLIFLASLAIIRYHQNKTVAAAQFQNSVEMIKNKKDSMESALIYKDDAGALDSYNAADEIFKHLTCSTKAEISTCATLKQELLNLASRAKKITTISPVLLADLNKKLGDNKLTGLIKLNSNLIGYGNATGTIFSFDLLTKETTEISASLASGGFTEGMVPKENDFALLGSNKKDWIKFDPISNSFTPSDIGYPMNKTTIVGGGIYNRRLYTLDSANSQIYRHDIIKTGFDMGREWLKSPAPGLALSDDLTIDGDVYILETNGQIEKFTSGLKVPFQIQGLFPTLANGGKIWTYADLNTLYVLDPVGNRLILLDKNGKLQTQITATEFKHPSGFAIDSANATAFVVDSGRLYSFPIPQ